MEDEVGEVGKGSVQSTHEFGIASLVLRGFLLKVTWSDLYLKTDQAGCSEIDGARKTTQDAL